MHTDGHLNGHAPGSTFTTRDRDAGPWKDVVEHEIRLFRLLDKHDKVAFISLHFLFFI